MDKKDVLSVLRELIIRDVDIRDPYMVGYNHALIEAIKRINGLTQRAADGADTWRKDNDLISDDYQSISAWCPNGCGKTMQVVRPGKFQCSECG